MKRVTIQRFLRYAFVGAIGTSAQYAVLAALVLTRTCSALKASCLGALAGALVNYALNYTMTFRSTGPHRRSAPRFLVVAVMAIVLNSVSMSVLMQTFHLPWLAAQGMTTVCLLLLTYSASSLWTFRAGHV